MTDSGCWWARGVGSSVTKRCAMRCSGPTTCSMQTRRRCSIGARCSQADSISTGAQAVADSDDKFATLDLLDALVRKSLAGRRPILGTHPLLDAGDHSPVRRGTTRHSGEANEARTRTPDTSQAAKPMCWRCGTVRDNARRTNGSPSSCRICAPRSGGRPTTSDLDTAAAIAIYAAFLGMRVEQHEPVDWAEELIEPAQAVDHRRLAQLYVMAAAVLRDRPSRRRCRLRRGRPGRHRQRPFRSGPIRRRGLARRWVPGPGSARAVGCRVPRPVRTPAIRSPAHPMQWRWP